MNNGASRVRGYILGQENDISSVQTQRGMYIWVWIEDQCEWILADTNVRSDTTGKNDWDQRSERPQNTC